MLSVFSYRWSLPPTTPSSCPHPRCSALAPPRPPPLQSWAALPLASRQQVVKMIGKMISSMSTSCRIYSETSSPSLNNNAASSYETGTLGLSLIRF